MKALLWTFSSFNFALEHLCCEQHGIQSTCLSKCLWIISFHLLSEPGCHRLVIPSQRCNKTKAINTAETLRDFFAFPNYGVQCIKTLPSCPVSMFTCSAAPAVCVFRGIPGLSSVLSADGNNYFGFPISPVTATFCQPTVVTASALQLNYAK